ncbi:glycerate dehydrogenase [Vibrio sp. MACH09]|uniref:D-2-hydroxyacid dehydrogenase n=1 Tax=Vibrio sp. MACH09 TaxID=3025122 RepID=UPI002790FFC0|nr:D-2-hydroxyacid dehydrogenase [Vibrio sp. MACH09]GLO63850.1 glycerate dehydrogenase [Vibrio sp. MACH09]
MAKKKIVCLDGETLNPGDNPWGALEKLGDFTCYSNTEQDVEQVITRAQSAHILLTNKVAISKAVIDACPDLEYIGVLATGYNVVDYRYAREKNINVVNVPAYGTDTVAEMVFALIFNLIRKVELTSQDVREQLGWTRKQEWTYTPFPQMELAGKTIGIVGFGRIGQRVAEIASVFKMNVLTYNRTPKSLSIDGAEQVDLDRLLADSDIVSVHCPVFPETENMFDEQMFKKMKSSALFINTARGQLVVESALANALNQGVIAGAALDTLQQEPPMEDNPLLSCQNCIITPHIAWATLDARKRITAMVADNIDCYLQGKAKNVVN